MKNFKSLLICTVIFMCMTGLAFTQETKKKVIGFIPMTMNNDYFSTMVKAAKSEAKKENIELFVESPVEGHRSGVQQENIVRNMITKGVDAICIVPASDGLVRVLKEAQQAKIPIITIDAKIAPDTIKKFGLATIPFIGTNNYEGAKKGGEYAISSLGISGKKIAILTGISIQQNAKDRLKGFEDAVGGKVKSINQRPANWEEGYGYSRLKEMLRETPDIAFVFACNDNMALGAIRAIKESGRKNIVVMGYDGVTLALNAIENGTMAATVAQLPSVMGITGVKIALEILKGNPAPEITYIETKVIDSSNVAEFKAYLNQYK